MVGGNNVNLLLERSYIVSIPYILTSSMVGGNTVNLLFERSNSCKLLSRPLFLNTYHLKTVKSIR